jgi:hypothetical protein
VLKYGGRMSCRAITQAPKRLPAQQRGYPTSPRLSPPRRPGVTELLGNEASAAGFWVRPKPDLPDAVVLGLAINRAGILISARQEARCTRLFAVWN